MVTILLSFRSVRDILGLRRDDDRRHGDDRRCSERGFADRRRISRRKRTVRGLLLGMFAMSVPASAARAPALRIAPQGFVSTSEAFSALPATIAYNDTIAEAADLYRLDPSLIRAIILAESAFNPFAVSSAGAQGLMQLMPALAEELTCSILRPSPEHLWRPRYLRQLLDLHKGNVNLAVASYNAGPGAVDRFNGIPPYRENPGICEEGECVHESGK
jgi:hypothetical protein